MTGAALGLGIGVAGTFLVGKLIDDASKCKPPAITKFLPLPDLLNLNHIVNPDCKNVYKGLGSDQFNNYRQTYPINYPSTGYDTIPLSSSNYPQSQTSTFSDSSIKTVDTQLTPDTVHYHYHHDGGFTQTGAYSPTPDAAINSHSFKTRFQTQKSSGGFSETGTYSASPDPVTTTSHPFLTNLLTKKDESHVRGESEYTLLPNRAIQPRALDDELKFSPLPKREAQASLFSETELTIPEFHDLEPKSQKSKAILFSPVEKKKTRTGRVNLEDRPLFSPVPKRNNDFKETVAILASPDDLPLSRHQESGQEQRAGRELEPSLFSPVPKKSNKFTETEAVAASPDDISSHQKNRDGRVLEPDVSMFSPFQKDSHLKSFSETEAIVAKPDTEKNAELSEAREAKDSVEFFSSLSKIHRDGRLLSSDNSQLRQSPKLFQKHLSQLSHEISAVPESSSSSETNQSPKSFKFGV